MAGNLGKEICKKVFIPPKTNLKFISIVSGYKSKIFVNPKKIPILDIYYKNTLFRNVKKIKEGGFGEIYLVHDDENSVIVKVPLEDFEEEPMVIEKVLRGYTHDIIPYRVVYDQFKNPFVVMQEANGTLDDLLNSEKITNVFRQRVIKFYTKAIYTFYKDGLVFTDMKLDNLLYQCTEKGLSLFFGDIGSFSRLNSDDFTRTYFPPEDLEENARVDKNFVLFTIGILIVEVYGVYLPDQKKIKTLNAYYKNFYLEVEKNIKSKIKDKKLANLCLALLSWDKTIREDLGVKKVYDML